MSAQPKEAVNHPTHYQAGGLEAIDVIEAAISDSPHMVPAYLQGQALKYLLRIWCKGNALEDARKCRWYIDRLIAKLEG